MCCGSAKTTMKQTNTTLRKSIQIEGGVNLRYLGLGAGLTWQAPSRRSYNSGKTGEVMTIHPDDTAWFLSRFERNKKLFELVPTEPVVVDNPPAVELLAEPEQSAFAVVDNEVTEPLAVDPALLVEDKPKRARKNKVNELNA